MTLLCDMATIVVGTAQKSYQEQLKESEHFVNIKSNENENSSIVYKKCNMTFEKYLI